MTEKYFQYKSLEEFQYKSLEECAAIALIKPNNFGYHGEKDMFKSWGLTPTFIHNASSILDHSNFQVVYQDLLLNFPDDVAIETFNHWAFGTVEQISCRVLKEPGVIERDNITKAFASLVIWLDKILDYPAADEEHYLNLCYLNTIEKIKDWGSQNSNLVKFEDSIDDPWYSKIYSEYTEQEFGFDSESIPDDNQLMQAVYSANLCNAKSIEQWNLWCDSNKLERPLFALEEISKINPTQLTLFGENNG